jgi:hypothetical protein
MKQRLITFAIVGFIIYFILSAPADAATLVSNTLDAAGDLLRGLADGLTTFIQNL